MWTEKKILKPHKYYGIFKMFDSELNGFPLTTGEMAIKGVDDRVKKFFKKYPHLKDYSEVDPFDAENYSQGAVSKHPATRFFLRQDKYMREGFTEEKSFELAEKEMSEELQKEKYERSLFEGLATSNRSRSLMSIYEQQAEYESRQKVNQMQRDLPNFQRNQVDLERRYEEILREKGQENFEQENPESKDSFKYVPVSYRTADMPAYDEKNFFKLQSSFTARSERLLDYFHSFAEIKDGISGLSDKEIILKANETPQKLKDSFKTMQKKLAKHDIQLNSEGKIDYTKIADPNVILWVKKNEKIISTCLICKDLEFEMPHIINRIEIKNQIMKEIEEEEKRFAEQKKGKEEEESEIEKLRRSKKNYESFFKIQPNYNADILVKQSGKFTDLMQKNMKKYVKFEEFVNEFSNRFMFDNDLLYETYYYWEDQEEKELRLRQLWAESRKTSLDSKVKKPEIFAKDLTKLNSDIQNSVRALRRKIDQTLLKNNKHPIFGANYRYMKREDLLIDSEIEFHKIKKFLQNSPEKIRDDPEIGIKYQELMTMLKAKQIGQETYAKNEDPVDELPVQVQEEAEDEENVDIQEESFKKKSDSKTRSSSQMIDNAVGTSSNKKIETIEEEMNKVKTKIVTHFENIIKSQAGGASSKKKDLSSESLKLKNQKIQKNKKK